MFIRACSLPQISIPEPSFVNLALLPLRLQKAKSKTYHGLKQEKAHEVQLLIVQIEVS